MKKIFLFTFLSFWCLTSAVLADDSWVANANGSLSDGANWVSGTAPFSDSTANSKGTLTQTSGTAVSTTGLVISGNTNFNQTGGSFNVTGGSIFVGRGGDYTNVSKLTINGGILSCLAKANAPVEVGGSSKGEVVMNDGELTANFYFALGNSNSNAWGKFTQNGGTVVSTTNTGWITIGHSGTGIYVMNGGSATAGKIDLGTENGTNSNGSLYVSGGTMKSNYSLQVGVTGTGLVEVSRETRPSEAMLVITGDAALGVQTTGGGTLALKKFGSMTVGGKLSIGSAGTGNFSIADDATLTVSKSLFAACASTANASAAQSGGTLAVTTNAVIGHVGTADWSMSGGTFSAQNLYVGNAGVGTLNVSGGTLNLAESLSIGNAIDSNFNPAAYSTGSGTMNVLAGANLTLSVPVSVAKAGKTTGALNLQGGSLTLASNDLTVGNSAGTGSAQLNLTSGTLSVRSLALNASSVSSQAGGTLKANSFSMKDGAAFTMTGGSLTKVDGAANYASFNLGSSGTGTTFTLWNGTINANSVDIGYGSGSADVIQYGGTFNSNFYFCLGNHGGSHLGTYTQYGGSVNATGGMGWLTIGHKGAGTYSIYGGDLTAKYVDLATQDDDTNRGTMNVFGGIVTSNTTFSVGVVGTGTLGIHGGKVVVNGALDGGTATSSINFYAGSNGFGSLSAQSLTYSGSLNAAVAPGGIASMTSFDLANGYDVLTLSSGTISNAKWTVSPLLEATGFGTNTLNLNLKPAARLSDYSLDSGTVSLATPTTSGWLSLTTPGSCYSMELAFANLADRDDFIDWINADGAFQASRGLAANSVSFANFVPDATLFAFDFSNYANGGAALLVSGFSGASVPEPAAWLLMLLGLPLLARFRRV